MPIAQSLTHDAASALVPSGLTESAINQGCISTFYLLTKWRNGPKSHYPQIRAKWQATLTAFVTPSGSSTETEPHNRRSTTQ